MPISFDAVLGIHEQALRLGAQRTELLASNIANSDTPGYKAKDIDFRAALQNAQSVKDGMSDSVTLKTTHEKHIHLSADAAGAELLYRVPNQASLDGNTVDSQMEQSAFAENAMRYQATLTFIDGKFKGLMSAFRGE